MSQKRLSKFLILSIENVMLLKLIYKNLINNFASKKIRKMITKINNYYLITNIYLIFKYKKYPT